MRAAANAILIKATLNNYITEDEVTDIVNDYFIEADFMNGMICKETVVCGVGSLGGIGNSELARSWEVNSKKSGVYIYMSVQNNMPEFPLAGQSSGNVTDRQVIIPEGDTFDAKVNPLDAFKLDTTYKAANRGTKLTVRLDAKVKLQIYMFGKYFYPGLPISTGEISAPAMYYYRNMTAGS